MCVYCRKAETEVLFNDETPSSRVDEGFNSQAAAVAQVLVRKLLS